MKSVLKTALALSVIILCAHTGLWAAQQNGAADVTQANQIVQNTQQQVQIPPVQLQQGWQCVTGKGYLPGQGPGIGQGLRDGRARNAGLGRHLGLGPRDGRGIGQGLGRGPGRGLGRGAINGQGIGRGMGVGVGGGMGRGLGRGGGINLRLRDGSCIYPIIGRGRIR